MDLLIVNNQKRKKRKTRKNLDAIKRKVEKANNKHGPSISVGKSIITKAPICITNNHLTLLNRVVRSDTVSRLIMPNTNLKSNDLKPSLKEKTKNNNMNNVLSNDCVFTNHDENGIPLVRNHTKRSILLFSPETDKSNISEPDLIPINTNFSDNEASHDYSCSQNSFYDELLNGISTHVKEAIPRLIKTDIIEQYKLSIQKISIQNDRFKSKDKVVIPNIMSSKDTSPENSIKDPIDYLEYSYKDFTKMKSPNDSVESIPTCATLIGSSSVEESSFPTQSNFSDSPDYTYYPHRLNP